MSLKEIKERGKRGRKRERERGKGGKEQGNEGRRAEKEGKGQREMGEKRRGKKGGKEKEGRGKEREKGERRGKYLCQRFQPCSSRLLCPWPLGMGDPAPTWLSKPRPQSPRLDPPGRQAGSRGSLRPSRGREHPQRTRCAASHPSLRSFPVTKHRVSRQWFGMELTASP